MFAEYPSSGLPKGMVYGYKVFKVRDKRLHFEFQTLHGNKIVPRRRWLKRARGTPGFCVFTTHAHAKAYQGGRVTRVKVRGGISYGYWNGYRGYCVREIYVP